MFLGQTLHQAVFHVSKLVVQAFYTKMLNTRRTRNDTVAELVLSTELSIHIEFVDHDCLQGSRAERPVTGDGGQSNRSRWICSGVIHDMLEYCWNTTLLASPEKATPEQAS